MKIFYGVQGTGNGHITRAREMAKAFREEGVEVTYLFSGREPARYFDMDIFPAYQVRKGLTFHTQNGDVSYLKTAFDARPIRLIREIKTLDIGDYDLVLCDFEPVTAWAAKLRNRKSLGIGHQYAFNYRIPRQGGDFIAERVLKYFAPAGRHIGLHWHHFGQPLLPPIIESREPPLETLANKIVVYLPFEDPRSVIRLLAPFKAHDFFVYTPTDVDSPVAHVKIRPLSRGGFQNDLHDCAGIVSNSGFELISEALQLGKKIMVKPLHSQMEQISNAAALKQLGYGRIMNELDPKAIAQWLENPHRVRVTYPNVAKILVRWMLEGMPPMEDDFIERCWSTVDVLHLNR
jgi:uncharacterized protein (TIGR00661 family)